MTPKFTWDVEAQAGYIQLQESQVDHQEESDELPPFKLIVDFTKDNKVVGIEIIKMESPHEDNRAG